MTPPNVISFYPKFDDEDIDQDKKIEEVRDWLEQHGQYGNLFMWYIDKDPISKESGIRGVKIYDPEIATLFRLMFDV